MKKRNIFIGFSLALCSLQAFAGWNSGAAGCIADFELAKTIACAANNPDTTSNPGIWYYRDSCVTTTTPNFIVQAHLVVLSSGSSYPFSYAANLQACTPDADAVANILRANKSPKAGQYCVGNPIFPLLGGKTETIHLGWILGGQSFSLTFDSNKQFVASAMGLDSRALGNIPALGGIWESSIHKNLKLGKSGFGITAFRGNGRTVSFRYDSTTSRYIADADVHDTMTLIPSITGGFRFVDVTMQTMEDYSASGLLQSVRDISGNVLTFNYSAGADSSAPAAGYLLNVSDNTGRFFKFQYSLPAGGSAETDGMVSTITNVAGQTITASYDSAKNLSTLTWPDGMVKTFVYENVDLPWALTGVIDEAGNRFSRFTYDSAGRATSTEHANGVDAFSVTYTTPPQILSTQSIEASTLTPIRGVEWIPAVNSLLTKPNGETISLSSNSVLGYPLFSGGSQSAGSGCNAANSASTYDTAGNLLSQDDFQGQRTCYAYDTKNQETTRIEGLSNTTDCATVLPANATLPANARRISTTWHPDWRLAKTVTAPGSITTTVHHGQPDPFNANTVANCTSAAALPNGKVLPVVCKQVVQATLSNGAMDTSVPNVVAQFTYDTAGRTLTAKDALNRTTSYTYYASTAFTGVDPNAVGSTVGDRQTITDPQGYVTTFNAYDKNGRVRQMTDPKGVVTDIVYTPRGWVSSVTTTAPGQTGRLTTYSYDNAGQMTGVTSPDGSTLSYSYDAAHRLVGVTDARGNSVTYTLDNSGNKVGEQIKDPSGTLQRSISRSFDALNRVQQITGAVQ